MRHARWAWSPLLGRFVVAAGARARPGPSCVLFHQRAVLESSGGRSLSNRLPAASIERSPARTREEKDRSASPPSPPNSDPDPDASPDPPGHAPAPDVPRRRRSRLDTYMTVVVIGYFGVASVFMLRHGQWLSPDQFIIVGFLAGPAAGQAPGVPQGLGALRPALPWLRVPARPGAPVGPAGALHALDQRRPLAVRGPADHPTAERLLRPPASALLRLHLHRGLHAALHPAAGVRLRHLEPGSEPSTIGSSPR